MSTLFGSSRYAFLRYALVIEILTALAPALRVKGRANDPLRQTGWWTLDQHSAVLVVAIAAIAGSALVFLAARSARGQWWKLLGCGLFAGEFPAFFYVLAAPRGTYLPLASMVRDGTLYGLIAGAALYGLLRAQPRPATLTPGSSGRTPGP